MPTYECHHYNRALRPKEIILPSGHIIPPSGCIIPPLSCLALRSTVSLTQACIGQAKSAIDGATMRVWPVPKTRVMSFELLFQLKQIIASHHAMHVAGGSVSPSDPPHCPKMIEYCHLLGERDISSPVCKSIKVHIAQMGNERVPQFQPNDEVI